MTHTHVRRPTHTEIAKTKVVTPTTNGDGVLGNLDGLFPSGLQQAQTQQLDVTSHTVADVLDCHQGEGDPLIRMSDAFKELLAAYEPGRPMEKAQANASEAREPK